MSHESDLRDNLLFELSQIRKELQVLLRIIGSRRHLSKDEIKVRAAASSLQSIYNGMERMLQTVLKHRNLLTPDSIAFHSELLKSALANGLISTQLESNLRSLMAFRHFYRHSYGFMIDNELMNPVLADVENVVSQLAKELQLE